MAKENTRTYEIRQLQEFQKAIQLDILEQEFAAYQQENDESIAQNALTNANALEVLGILNRIDTSTSETYDFLFSKISIAQEWCASRLEVIYHPEQFRYPITPDMEEALKNIYHIMTAEKTYIFHLPTLKKIAESDELHLIVAGLKKNSSLFSIILQTDLSKGRSRQRTETPT